MLRTFYHVTSDPEETTNLTAAHPDVAAALRERLEAWLATGQTQYAPQTLSPEAERELRALGYIE